MAQITGSDVFNALIRHSEVQGSPRAQLRCDGRIGGGANRLCLIGLWGALSGAVSSLDSFQSALGGWWGGCCYCRYRRETGPPSQAEPKARERVSGRTRESGEPPAEPKKRGRMFRGGPETLSGQFRLKPRAPFCSRGLISREYMGLVGHVYYGRV